jgi:CRISPR/Cas system-associated exonuclease Cas4 (RecB family)
MVNFSKLKEKKESVGKIFKHDFLHEFDAYNVDSPAGRVYVTPDGKFPSVTSFLGAVTDKSFLIKWKEKLGEEAADIESKRCTDRGTGVHLSLEYLLRNTPDPLHAGIYKHMYNQLAVDLSINLECVMGLEIPLWSKKILGLAGRVDCVGIYKGEISIVDFKTSTKFKRIEHITNYILQCCCYAIMVEEMYSIPIDKLVIMIALESAIKPQIFTASKRDYLPLLASKIKEFRLIQQNKIIEPVSLFDSW